MNLNLLPQQEDCQLTLETRALESRQNLGITLPGNLLPAQAEMLTESATQLGEEWLDTLYAALHGPTLLPLVLYLYGALRDLKPLNQMLSEIEALSIGSPDHSAMENELMVIRNVICNSDSPQLLAMAYSQKLLERCKLTQSASRSFSG